MSRFPDWRLPTFDKNGETPWGWRVRYPERLSLGIGSDVGAFTYIQAEATVVIGTDAELGAHCAIYSVSTIDGKRGPVVIADHARVGAHSVVMPGVTIGKGAVVGACSFVNKDIPAGCVAYGVPARVVKRFGKPIVTT